MRFKLLVLCILFLFGCSHETNTHKDIHTYEIGDPIEHDSIVQQREEINTWIFPEYTCFIIHPYGPNSIDELCIEKEKP